MFSILFKNVPLQFHKLKVTLGTSFSSKHCIHSSVCILKIHLTTCRLCTHISNLALYIPRSSPQVHNTRLERFVNRYSSGFIRITTLIPNAQNIGITSSWMFQNFKSTNYNFGEDIKLFSKTIRLLVWWNFEIIKWKIKF